MMNETSTIILSLSIRVIISTAILIFRKNEENAQ
jgi:hypothetical protein